METTVFVFHTLCGYCSNTKLLKVDGLNTENNDGTIPVNINDVFWTVWDIIKRQKRLQCAVERIFLIIKLTMEWILQHTKAHQSMTKTKNLISSWSNAIHCQVKFTESRI